MQLNLALVFLWPPCIAYADIQLYPCGLYLSFFLPSFLPILSSRRLHAYLPYFCTCCGLSANLEYRSEMCCTRPHNFVRLYLRNWGMYRQSEIKLGKQQYLLHMSSQYGELQPTTSWDLLVNLGHPSKFQQVSRLVFLTAPTPLNGGQPNFAQCLTFSWYTICTFLGLLPRGILPGAKFTLRPSLPFSYIGRVTAWHSSSGRQPDFVASYLQWQGGHPVRHWAVELSSCVFLLLYISFDWWICAFVVLVLVCLYQAKRLAWGTCPKWPILCWVGVGHKTSISQSIVKDQELYYS